MWPHCGLSHARRCKHTTLCTFQHLGTSNWPPGSCQRGVGMLINNQRGNMVNDKREEPGSDQLATLRLHRSLSLSAEKP